MDVAAALRALGLQREDLAAWEATGLPESAFGGWVTDRVARRPEGARARAVYGAEDAHDFARRAVLGALVLDPGDRLLEIGCGGGLLLRDALAAGAAATGLDHSPEMVALARERAPGAEVLEGDALALPFAGGAFTAVAMSVVLLFLAGPALRCASAAACSRPAAGSPPTRPRPSCAARPPRRSRSPRTCTSTRTRSWPRSPARPASATSPWRTTTAASC